MIVEDEPLVALEIEDTLEEAGYGIAGIAGDPDQALELLEREAVDVAVLDANLGGRSAAPVAERLKAKGIPFLVVTGYSARQLGHWVDGVPVLSKPFDSIRLVDTIRKLNGGRSAG